MKRTTVMADEALLAEARRLARREEVSLAEIIRQGIELRVRRRAVRPSFVGAFASGSPGHTVGRDSGEAPFEPLSWR